MKKLFSIISLLLILFGCNIEEISEQIESTTPLENGKGRIVINIKWPVNNRTIPVNTEAIKMMILQKNTEIIHENIIIERGESSSETTSIDLLPRDYEIYAIAVGQPEELTYNILGYGYIDNADYISIQKDTSTPANITIKHISDYMSITYDAPDNNDVQVGDTITTTVYLDKKMKPFTLRNNTISYRSSEAALATTITPIWIDNLTTFTFELEIIETIVYGVFYLGNTNDTSYLNFSDSGYNTAIDEIPLYWDSYNVSGEATIVIE